MDSNIQIIIHHLRTHKYRLHPIVSLQNSQQMPPMLQILVTSLTNLTSIYYMQTTIHGLHAHNCLLPHYISTGLSYKCLQCYKNTTSHVFHKSQTIVDHLHRLQVPIASPLHLYAILNKCLQCYKYNKVLTFFKNYYQLGALHFCIYTRRGSLPSGTSMAYLRCELQSHFFSGPTPSWYSGSQNSPPRSSHASPANTLFFPA